MSTSYVPVCPRCGVIIGYGTGHICQQPQATQADPMWQYVAVATRIAAALERIAKALEAQGEHEGEA